jgi:hypothetical protein
MIPALPSPSPSPSPSSFHSLSPSPTTISARGGTTLPPASTSSLVVKIGDSKIGSSTHKNTNTTTTATTTTTTGATRTTTLLRLASSISSSWHVWLPLSLKYLTFNEILSTETISRQWRSLSRLSPIIVMNGSTFSRILTKLAINDMSLPGSKGSKPTTTIIGLPLTSIIGSSSLSVQQRSLLNRLKQIEILSFTSGIKFSTVAWLQWMPRLKSIELNVEDQVSSCCTILVIDVDTEYIIDRRITHKYITEHT